MRGYRYVFSVLAVFLSVTHVSPQAQDSTAATGTLLVGSKPTALFVPVDESRHMLFRPLVATRQRNRELEQRLQEQRRRLKLKKSSKRNSGHTGRVQPKSLRTSQFEPWNAEPSQNFEFLNSALPQSQYTENRQFIVYPSGDETMPAQDLVMSEFETKTPNANSVMFLLSRPRREIASNSSEGRFSVPIAKDSDDVRPSSNMMLMFAKPAATRQIRDVPAESTTAGKNVTTDDKESMETAENMIFHPLFVHRLKKADRNRRRQLQMRPQKRPQKPQRQQSRPQQRPAARPQSKPQQARPQRPVQSTSQKKPQSIRRGQYYYVTASGPFGQWVYYPYYYY